MYNVRGLLKNQIIGAELKNIDSANQHDACVLLSRFECGFQRGKEIVRRMHLSSSFAMANIGNDLFLCL